MIKMFWHLNTIFNRDCKGDVEPRVQSSISDCGHEKCAECPMNCNLPRKQSVDSGKRLTGNEQTCVSVLGWLKYVHIVSWAFLLILLYVILNVQFKCHKMFYQATCIVRWCCRPSSWYFHRAQYSLHTLGVLLSRRIILPAIECWYEKLSIASNWYLILTLASIQPLI